MKKFLFVFIGSLFFVAGANAAQCTYDLKNGRGMTLDSFNSWGYDRFDACRDARYECQRAIRNGRYRARYLSCEERVMRRPHRPMVQRSCTAYLRGPYGGTQRTFLGRASGPQGTGVLAEACSRARRQCETFRTNSRRWGASCVTSQYGNGRGGVRIGIGGVRIGIN